VLLVGLNLMAKSVNLLMLFVALELVSIASYLLTTILKKQKGAIESGLKYILYGTLSSGVMLYGMSFLYGFGGSLSFTQPLFWTNLSLLSGPLFLVIFLLTFAGFLFKVAAAPFHFWAPDVYEGAPTPVVAFFSTAPKIAGFVVIIRFLFQIKTYLAAPLQNDLVLLVGGISLITLIIGNFTALWQTKARRLLAYSSVAHAGFVLAALAALATNAIEAVLFYLSILLFMNFGIFLLVQVLEEKLHIFDLKGLSGFGKTYPMLGVLSIIILISLTGLPPTAGFTSKLLIFTNIWQNYATSGSQMLLILLLAGLLLTGVAFFYYIRIPYFLFFKRNFSAPEKVVLQKDNIVLALLVLPLLLFFFQPVWLTKIIQQVVFYSK
jgi:NADH-quinone oxidoreductase subunit N